MQEKHKTAFLIGLGFIIIGFLAKTLYRDFINSDGINDFGLAGSLPSFLYVIGFSQLLLIRPIKYPPLVMVVVTFGSIIYEYKQVHWSGSPDINDIIASVLGGVISYLILVIVERRYKNQDLNE